MLQRDKSGALKAMMSKSPGGAKLAAGRLAMRDRRAARAAELEHSLAQFSGTIETMFLAAAADGRVSRGEVDHMADIVCDITDGDLSRDDVVEMIQNFAEAVERDGYEGRLDTLAAALDDDTRRSAFTLAVAIAMGDGRIDDGEEALFHDLAETYDIPDHEAEAIVEDVARTLTS